jgi:hypothetical protein
VVRYGNNQVVSPGVQFPKRSGRYTFADKLSRFASSIDAAANRLNDIGPGLMQQPPKRPRDISRTDNGDSALVVTQVQIPG